MNKHPSFFAFDNSYSRLPEQFYARVNPTPVEAPRLIEFNDVLAEELGVSASLKSPAGAAILSGNHVPEGASPIAMAYAGHQFGHFAVLGDGRAVLLGEFIDKQGKRRDIHLKGSGRTPYSRRGDGRAALGPMLREYIISEALHALGIPTSRSLAVIATGEPVFREMKLPGAVLTRIAASHIRVGTFEYCAAQNDRKSLKILADYAIDRHYPNLRNASNPYLAFLEKVADAQALLIARWMAVGFIHGVMNTDNMAISGETIDYGPCAFMDIYDPATVFSSIDEYGRYSYSNQPHIGQWNIARLAEALLPLLDDDRNEAVEMAAHVCSQFFARYDDYWLQEMRHKIGLLTSQQGDFILVQSLLTIMHEEGSDFTNTFRLLCSAADGAEVPAAYRNWVTAWQKRRSLETQPPMASLELMRTSNPIFIPRNHRVEEAIADAEEKNDLSKLNLLLKVLSSPFEEQLEYSAYQNPPNAYERVYQTFCGT